MGHQPLISTRGASRDQGPVPECLGFMPETTGFNFTLMVSPPPLCLRNRSDLFELLQSATLIGSDGSVYASRAQPSSARSRVIMCVLPGQMTDNQRGARSNARIPGEQFAVGGSAIQEACSGLGSLQVTPLPRPSILPLIPGTAKHFAALR